MLHKVAPNRRRADEDTDYVQFAALQQSLPLSEYGLGTACVLDHAKASMSDSCRLYAEMYEYASQDKREHNES